NKPKCTVGIEVEISELGFTNPRSIREHCVENGIKLAGRGTDDLENLRCGRLLFQRLGKFARPLLLRLEQPHALDRDHRLVSEGFHQLDLLRRERPDDSPMQEKNANRYPFAKQWDARDGAKVAESCGFRVSPFRIGQNIRNLTRFALQQNSAAYTAASGFKAQGF